MKVCLKTLIALIFLFSCESKIASQLNFSSKTISEERIEVPKDRVLAPGVVVDLRCDQADLLYPLGYNDEFSGCAWHIINRSQYIKKDPSQIGEEVYENRTLSGVDLSLTQYALEKYSGKNIKVHIIDFGINYKHPDLIDNFNQEDSKGCDGYNQAPAPDRIGLKTNHGTAVAGIIGASKNSIGLSGIAPDSKLSYYNIGSSCVNLVEALEVSKVDIVNMSFGQETCFEHIKTTENDYNAIYNNSDQADVLYLSAAGNEKIEKTSVTSEAQCPGYGDTNRYNINAHPYTFSVGAVNEKGEVADYSNPGSSLFIMGIGSSKDIKSPGICSTSFNDTYDCKLKETSAATPMISGISALIKEANPKLNNIDTAFILAKTATPIEEEITTKSYQEKNLSIEEKKYINYSINSQGLKHSYNSGFGLVNGDKAVKLAESYENFSGPLEKYESNIFSSDDNISVKKEISAKTCESISVSLTKDFKVFNTIWSFEIQGAVKDLVIFQKAADQTNSQLIRDSLISNKSYEFFHKFKSFSALGTNAKGDWQVEICNNGSEKVFWNKVNLQVFGYEDLNKLKL